MLQGQYQYDKFTYEDRLNLEDHVSLYYQDFINMPIYTYEEHVNLEDHVSLYYQDNINVLKYTS